MESSSLESLSRARQILPAATTMRASAKDLLSYTATQSSRPLRIGCVDLALSRRWKGTSKDSPVNLIDTDN